MKTQLSITVALMLFGVCSVQAEVWTSGHHVITDANDPFGEIWMSNDATADILGGEIFKLETFDITGVDIFGGQMDLLYVHDNSAISIHGGSLDALGVTENGFVYLYAYDVIYHPTGGHFDRGWVEGRYLDNDLYFNFDLDDLNSFSHITVVPEPTSVLLFAFGGLFLRKQR